MKPTSKSTRGKGNIRPWVWFGLLGALLAATNNAVAIIGLGFAQGPIVAFTTPFVFGLAKYRYPRYFAATAIFVPLVVLSIFTVNFGPPGPYKPLFLFGPIFYDAISYLLGFGKKDSRALWKLMVAVAFYPLGLLLGGLIAIQWIAVELPILSRGIVGGLAMVALFIVVGGFATWVASKTYYGWLSPIDEESIEADLTNKSE